MFSYTKFFQHPLMQNLAIVTKFGSVAYCMSAYVFQITQCVGPSMLPTLNSAGDIVILDRMSSMFRDYEVGDVIVAKSPTNPRQTVCKRIIAIEGQSVKTIPRFNKSKEAITQIPKGHVWIEGDNELNSTDSRHYGPIPSALIKGRVLWRIWPLNEATRIS